MLSHTALPLEARAMRRRNALKSLGNQRRADPREVVAIKCWTGTGAPLLLIFLPDFFKNAEKFEGLG
jgi:hypothetical protein